MKHGQLIIRLVLLMGSSHAALAQSSPAPEDTAAAASEAEQVAPGDIVVTAERRSSSIQRVPIAIQALDGAALKAQNITNFTDYVAHLPGVNFAGRGPGQQEVYIRGLSSNKVGVQNAGASGVQPNVALYLDDQPITLGGRNLDIYVTDLERIEVLSGPQGTQFGASSEAGTVRLITNKPKLNKFEAGGIGSTSFTHKGAMSSSIEGYVNVPIIEGKLAIRIAGYSVKQGGYIDNTLGSTVLSSSNPYFPAGATLEPVTNTALVEKDFNDTTYNGFRAGLKYEISDDWNLSLQHSRQVLESDGVFQYDPTVGDLEVHRYYPDNLQDRHSQTSWNLEGRLGPLKVIYNGGYINRKIRQQLDYTAYGNVGPFVPYYVCNYPAYTRCADPTIGYNGRIRSTRWNHELRISSPQDWRLRFSAGVYYDKGKNLDRSDYDYPSAREFGLQPNRPLPQSTVTDPSFGLPGVTYINDYTRKDHQLAFFGEASFDIVPDELTIAAGFRRYHLVYSLGGSTSFANRGPVDLDSGINVDEVLAGRTPAKENGVVPRVTLTWKPTNRIMLYTTYSKGFRPGGFNRNGTTDEPGRGVPFGYTTDHLANYEGGWKTTLLGNKVRFNGSIYYMRWTGIQTSAIVPSFSPLFFNDNAADATVWGVQLDSSVSPVDGLTVSGAISYNHSELTAVSTSIVNIAPIGSSLAQSPRIQANASARYSWEIGDYSPFLQAGIQYSGHSYSSLEVAKRVHQGAYAIGNASVGVSNGPWNASLFVDNISDTRADLYANTEDNSLLVVTNRPRTIGIRVGADF